MIPCQTSPDMWFSEDPVEIAEAKARCGGCPLSRFRECGERGWSEEFGVFGGLSADDRRAADPARYAALVQSNRDRSRELDRELTVERAYALLREGLTMVEVGARMGKSAGAVQKLLWRARNAA